MPLEWLLTYFFKWGSFLIYWWKSIAPNTKSFGVRNFRINNWLWWSSSILCLTSFPNPVNYSFLSQWLCFRAQEVLGFPTPASVLDKTYALELQKCNFLSIFSPSHCGWWTLPWRWSCMGSFCASLLMEKALDFVWWRIPGSRDFLPFATSKRCLLLPFPSRNPMKGC